MPVFPNARMPVTIALGSVKRGLGFPSPNGASRRMCARVVEVASAISSSRSIYTSSTASPFFTFSYASWKRGFIVCTKSSERAKPPESLWPPKSMKDSCVSRISSTTLTEPSERHEPFIVSPPSLPHRHTLLPYSSIIFCATSPRRPGRHEGFPMTIIPDGTPSSFKRLRTSLTVEATTPLRTSFR